MNENKTALLKIFSTVLKDRVKSEPRYQSISPEMVRFFSRKELIEIITHNFNGEVPEDYNLAELENGELLQLIGDDFSIIFYVMGKWSKEALQLPTLQEWMHSKVHSSADTTSTTVIETGAEQKPVGTRDTILESDPKIGNIPGTPPQAKVSELPESSDNKSDDRQQESKPGLKPEQKPAPEKPAFIKKQDDKKPEKK